MRLTLTLACAAATLLLPASFALLPATEAFAQVTEEETSVKFEEYTKIDDLELKVCGAGVREKGWIDVYACALYIDRVAATKKLSKWIGKSASSLRGDNDFYSDLIYSDMGKALVLELVRDVDAEAMRDALEEGIEADTSLDANAKALIKEMDTDFESGDRLTFQFMPGWKIRLDQGGKVGKTYEGKALCVALLKIWLGRDPISDDIKDHAVDWIPNMIKK